MNDLFNPTAPNQVPLRQLYGFPGRSDAHRSSQNFQAANSLDSFTAKRHIRMANQSILRKNFPQDFFPKDPHPPTPSSLSKSPYPPKDLLPKWVRGRLNKQTRSTSENGFIPGPRPNSLKTSHPTYLPLDLQSLHQSAAFPLEESQSAKSGFPKRRKAAAVFPTNSNKNFRNQNLNSIFSPLKSKNEPEPQESDQQLLMATFRLQNTQRKNNFQDRARSLQREGPETCSKIKVANTRSSIGCGGERLSGTKYFRKIMLQKDNLKMKNTIMKMSGTALTKKVKNHLYVSQQNLKSPDKPQTVNKEKYSQYLGYEDMCIVGQTPNFKAQDQQPYTNSETAPSSNRECSEQRNQCEFVEDLGAFLKKNSFRVSNFIQENFHSLQNSRKPTPIANASCTLRNCDLRRQLQKISMFDQPSQPANLVKQSIPYLNCVDNSFQSNPNGSNIPLPQSSTFIPNIDLSSLRSPSSQHQAQFSQFQIQSFQNLNALSILNSGTVRSSRAENIKRLDFFSSKKNQDNILFDANETLKQSQKLRLMLPSAKERSAFKSEYRSSSIQADNSAYESEGISLIRAGNNSSINYQRGQTPLTAKCMPRHSSHQNFTEFGEPKESCRTEAEESKSKKYRPKIVRINGWNHEKQKSQDLKTKKMLPPMKPQSCLQMPNHDKENLLLRSNQLASSRKFTRRHIQMTIKQNRQSKEVLDY